VTVFRFLNNNDTGPRFITRHGAGWNHVAAAMLLTLPGLPGLYAGDDVGAAFEPYRPHGPISWDDPQGLRAWYTRLIALRARLPALRSHELRVLDTGPADQVLAYVRTASEGDGDVLVLLNFGAAAARFSLTEEMRAGLRGGMIDLLSSTQTAPQVDDGVIVVPPYGVRILQKPEHWRGHSERTRRFDPRAR
jgi:glycosidase